jgi:hypothetical protein
VTSRLAEPKICDCDRDKEPDERPAEDEAGAEREKEEQPKALVSWDKAVERTNAKFR